MLGEGSSKRSTSRVADVSINIVSKLLTEAGEACLAVVVAKGLVARIDAMAPSPKPRGPYKKRTSV